MQDKKIILDIPALTILKVLAVIAAVVLVYLIRDVVVLFFIVLVIVAALSPIVDRWSKHLPRSLVVAVIFILLFAVIAGVVGLIEPIVAAQIAHLSELIQKQQSLPPFIQKLLPGVDSWKSLTNISGQSLSSLSSNLGKIGSSLLSTIQGFVAGVVAIISVIVLTFYLLLEEEGAKKFIKSILPPTYKESIIDTANKISMKMGAWMRGQLTLMLIVGLLDLIGLLILGVPYALTFAIWAGLVEAIAFIGPVLGAIPAVLVAFTISPLIGLLTIAMFIIVQQIENQLLVPKIMGRAVGLSSVVILFAILIGAKLLGILGVVLAVPAAGAISVIYQEWPKIKGLKNE